MAFAKFAGKNKRTGGSFTREIKPWATVSNSKLPAISLNRRSLDLLYPKGVPETVNVEFFWDGDRQAIGVGTSTDVEGSTSVYSVKVNPKTGSVRIAFGAFLSCYGIELPGTIKCNPVVEDGMLVLVLSEGRLLGDGVTADEAEDEDEDEAEVDGDDDADEDEDDEEEDEDDEEEDEDDEEEDDEEDELPAVKPASKRAPARKK